MEIEEVVEVEPTVAPELVGAGSLAKMNRSSHASCSAVRGVVPPRYSRCCGLLCCS